LIDPDTGKVRRARSSDIARIAHLVNELHGYDLLAIPVIADDAPSGRYHLSRYYPALKNTVKPVFGSAPNSAELKDLIHLAELVAGNAEKYHHRPFLTFGVCPVISPLVMDNDSTEMLMYFAEHQLPHIFVSAPNAGMTAPMTLLGTLAQCNAEFLATAVLSQISRSGTPIIYDALPTVADMRTGAYAPGGIETGIMLMGCAQMARFYNVPSAGFMGLTNAKLNDAQSGYETGLSTMAALNAGVDLFHLGGLLDGLSAFDFAKLVIDSEIALMLKRAMRGFECNQENFALDVIKQVGPGGTFINMAHTRMLMRKTALLPGISDRDPRSRWEDTGSVESHTRAIQKARKILERDNASVFSSDFDDRILTKFEDLGLLVTH
jgi:trimethylamine--corrinoid protein Co-methyltransferase